MLLTFLFHSIPHAPGRQNSRCCCFIQRKHNSSKYASSGYLIYLSSSKKKKRLHCFCSAFFVSTKSFIFLLGCCCCCCRFPLQQLTSFSGRLFHFLTFSWPPFVIIVLKIKIVSGKRKKEKHTHKLENIYIFCKTKFSITSNLLPPCCSLLSTTEPAELCQSQR